MARKVCMAILSYFYFMVIITFLKTPSSPLNILFDSQGKKKREQLLPGLGFPRVFEDVRELFLRRDRFCLHGSSYSSRLSLAPDTILCRIVVCVSICNRTTS